MASHLDKTIDSVADQTEQSKPIDQTEQSKPTHQTDQSKTADQTESTHHTESTDDKINPKVANLNYLAIPFGLKNIGNTCYLNSVVQALMSIPQFCKTLLDNKMKPHFQKNSIANELTKLAEKTTSDVEGILRIWVILLNTADQRKDAVKIERGKQSDAHECFALLMEYFETYLPELWSLFHIRTQTVALCGKCNKKAINKEENSCMILFPSVQSFIGYDGKKSPIDKLVKVQSGKIDDFRCATCGDKSSKIFVTYVKRVSEIMCVVGGNYGVGKEDITFPLEIKFNAVKRQSFIYKRLSTIEHHGGVSGGHYIAHGVRKHEDKIKYTTLNDSSVSECELSEGPSSNTYMAFYSLVKIDG